jgi:hypothetical protein
VPASVRRLNRFFCQENPGLPILAYRIYLRLKQTFWDTHTRTNAIEFFSWKTLEVQPLNRTCNCMQTRVFFPTRSNWRIYSLITGHRDEVSVYTVSRFAGYIVLGSWDVCEVRFRVVRLNVYFVWLHLMPRINK